MSPLFSKDYFFYFFISFIFHFKNTDDSYNLCNYLELESYEPSETIFEEVLYKLFFFFFI